MARSGLFEKNRDHLQIDNGWRFFPTNRRRSPQSRTANLHGSPSPAGTRATSTTWRPSVRPTLSRSCPVPALPAPISRRGSRRVALGEPRRGALYPTQDAKELNNIRAPAQFSAFYSSYPVFRRLRGAFLKGCRRLNVPFFDLNVPFFDHLSP